MGGLKIPKTAPESKKAIFSKSEIKKTIKNLDPKVKSSIDLAFSRIVNFHKKQKFQGFKTKDKYNNVFSYRSKPMNKIGVVVQMMTILY